MKKITMPPSDLTLVSDRDLRDLESRCISEFWRVNRDDRDEPTPEALEYQIHLTNDIERLRATMTGRRAAARYLARRRRSDVVEDRKGQLRDALWERVHGKGDR